MAKPNRISNTSSAATQPSAPIIAPTVEQLPAVAAAAEIETAVKKGRITNAWVGDVITWTIPGATLTSPSLDTSKLTDQIKRDAFEAGIAAKGTDGAAKKEGATPDEKSASISRICESLLAGNWNQGRSGQTFGDGVLMDAMNEYAATNNKPVRFADVATYQKFLTDGAASHNSTIKTFIENMEAGPKLSAIVTRLKAAKYAVPGFDADAILDGE